MMLHKKQHEAIIQAWRFLEAYASAANILSEDAQESGDYFDYDEWRIDQGEEAMRLLEDIVYPERTA